MISNSYKLLIFAAALLFNNTLVAEVIGIGTPYLPNNLALVNSNDLITNIIVNNLSTTFIAKKDNPQDEFKPKKISRKSLNNQEIVELEYHAKPTLSRSKNFSAESIKASLRFFQEHYRPEYNLPSLLQIDKIHSSESPNGFNILLTFKNYSPAVLDQLAKIPLINEEAAKTFKSDLAKGTNLPLYAKFHLKSLDQEALLLDKNSYHGSYNDVSGIDSIVFRKFNESNSRMRAIRAGSIAIIVAPTLAEIEDASSDPTLKVIASPFKNENYKMAFPNNFQESEFEIESLIVRKSFKPDIQFSKLFQLSGITKGSL